MSGLAAVGLIAFLAVAVAEAPASLAGLALDSAGTGVTYEASSGTVWNGSLRGLAWRGIDLGEVRFQFEHAALLTGRLAASARAESPALKGRGVLSIGVFGGWSARNVEAVLDLNQFRDIRLLGTPLSGSATIRVKSIGGSARGCRNADGEVSTDAAAQLATRFGVKGFPLKGPIRCENGALVLPLSGRAAQLRADAILRFEPSGRIGSAVEIVTENSDLALALQTLGFHNDNGVWRLESAMEPGKGPK